MRTREEIDVEIQNLRDIKPKVPTFTAFGDNNHKMIEDSIAVLENRLSSGDIDPDDECDRYNNVRDTEQWLSGRSDETPSEGWKGLD